MSHTRQSAGHRQSSKRLGGCQVGATLRPATRTTLPARISATIGTTSATQWRGGRGKLALVRLAVDSIPLAPDARLPLLPVATGLRRAGHPRRRRAGASLRASSTETASTRGRSSAPAPATLSCTGDPVMYGRGAEDNGGSDGGGDGGSGQGQTAEWDETGAAVSEILPAKLSRYQPALAEAFGASRPADRAVRARAHAAVAHF